MSKNKIIKGAIILTLANIITRILGFVYRIYMSNLIGAEGMGLYQLIMPIYMLVWSISSSGFSTTISKLVAGFVYRIYMSNLIGAEGMGLYQLIMPIYMLVWSISSSGFSTTISKLVAEENSKKQYGNIKRILSICIFISGFIACLLSFFVFIFSGYISNNILKNENTLLSIHIMCISFPFMAIGSCIRGYFLGMQETSIPAGYISNNILKNENTLLSIHIMCISFPFMAIGSCIRGYFLGMQETSIPAISQVLEQVSRIISVYLLASIFVPMGLSYACAVGAIGMCIGEIFSFLYVLMIYNTKVNKTKKPNISTIKYTSLILAMSIPLTANRVLGSFLSTIENILIPQKLIEYGYSNAQAMSLYGQLSGMSMPLVMFPSSLLTALAITIVPAISEALARNNITLIKNTIIKSFTITSFIGIGTSGLFIFFSNELGITIYSQQDIGWQLLYIGFLCPFLYLQVTLSGILNGLGQQFLIFKNSLISSIINICFIYFLIPKYNLYAFILGWFLSLIVVNIISIIKLKHKINFKINFINTIFKPIVCIASSGIVAKYCYNLIVASYNKIFSLIIGLSILCLIYLILLVLLGALTKEDLKFLK